MCLTLQNTEQILESVGLYAYKIGALESLNEKLAELGPKSMKKNFIRIKDNRNKNLEVTKNHIKIVSSNRHNAITNRCYHMYMLNVHGLLTVTITLQLLYANLKSHVLMLSSHNNQIFTQYKRFIQHNICASRII